MTTKEKKELIQFVVSCILGIIGGIVFVLRACGIIPQIHF